jgi:DNA (cytosine-5)-methyltransferase 1
MPKLHINFQDTTIKTLKQKATEYNCSVPEFIERAMEALVLKEQTDELFFNPRPTNGNGKSELFTFIDLFAGIGGIRIAFEKQGGKCLYSSEWDKWCKETYFKNFGELPRGDITKILPEDFPSHDILTAGFPCQPFSLAGVSKKKSLGREHGFLDKAQGTLFFNTAEIIKEKRPKMFLLENVKNLFNHDKGNTFKVIEGTLRDELKYHLFYDVIDARNYVPQHRERLIIVGFDKKLFKEKPDFKFPKPPKAEPKLDSILEKKVDPKYILSAKLWQYLQDYAEKHRKKGNGFGFGLFDGSGVARTLSARYYKDGSEILIKVPGSSRPRRLTPKECAALQGFPKGFKIPVSDTQAYKQFGNSVAVPVVKAVAKQMLKVYKSHPKASKS